MSFKYYLVYSFKEKSGNVGVGRTSVSSKFQIDTTDRVEQVEAEVIRSLNEKGQQIDNLFLTWWQEIRH